MYLSYRRGLLKQAGSLRIQYNRFGDIVGTRGHVNRTNSHCNIGSFDDTWFDDDFDQFDEDFYYYKRDGKTHKRKKAKHLKRRQFDD